MIGPTKSLAVKRGDQVTLSVNAFYLGADSEDNVGAENIIPYILGAFSGQSVVDGQTFDPDGMMPSDANCPEGDCDKSPEETQREYYQQQEEYITEGIQEINEAFDNALTKLQEAFSFDKIEIEGESSTERSKTDIKDGIVVEKGGDQPDNAPEGEGAIVEEPSESSLGFNSPDELSRAQQLWDAFVKPFVDIVNPDFVSSGDSVVVQFDRDTRCKTCSNARRRAW